MAEIVDWLAIGLGLIGAGLWLWAALVRTPQQITTGWGGVGGSVQDLGDAIRKQSRLNAFAAGFTAAAMLCQIGGHLAGK